MMAPFCHVESREDLLQRPHVHLPETPAGAKKLRSMPRAHDSAGLSNSNLRNNCFALHFRMDEDLGIFESKADVPALRRYASGSGRIDKCIARPKPAIGKSG